jgi:transcriptional regulator with XRE-family HTH domain
MTAHRTLKAYRKAHQLSQRAAARKFTITQAEWCRIERGERCPRPKLAQRISNRTGVPLKTLLGL